MDSEEVLAELVREARFGALHVMDGVRDGDVPKFKGDGLYQLVRLHRVLTRAQREMLRQGVKYIVDFTLFELLKFLETKGAEKGLELRRVIDGKVQEVLIGREVDVELRSEFWSWIERRPEEVPPDALW